jgi:hypothetical protein
MRVVSSIGYHLALDMPVCNSAFDTRMTHLKIGSMLTTTIDILVFQTYSLSREALIHQLLSLNERICHQQLS